MAKLRQTNKLLPEAQTSADIPETRTTDVWASLFAYNF